MIESYDSQLEERIAELQGLLDTLQEPVKTEQAANGPFLYSEAEDFAKQLGDYLRKLHKEDLDNHTTNSTWLRKIDDNIKAININMVALVILAIIMPLIFRSCGG